MTLADLQRLDELPDGGTVAWKVGGRDAQRRRTGRASLTQSVDEGWNVATAGAVEIHGDTVVEERGEIAAGDAHSTDDERAESAQRRGGDWLTRQAHGREGNSVVMRGALTQGCRETLGVE